MTPGDLKLVAQVAIRCVLIEGGYLRPDLTCDEFERLEAALSAYLSRLMLPQAAD